MLRGSTGLLSRRVVVIGGVAGGATAAARIVRMDATAHVTIIERGPDVSIAGCGLPYYLGREIKDRAQLALHTPASLQQLTGVTQVRTLTEALSIDAASKKVTVCSLGTGATEDLLYDSLILSPGASPFIPGPIAALKDPRIVAVRNLADVDRIDKQLRDEAGCRRVVVVGAGFIGLEMAEQLRRIGKEVTVVEKAPHVLPQVDAEVAHFMHETLATNGVRLFSNNGIAGVDPAAEELRVSLESGEVLPADMLVMSIGVRPETGFIKSSGVRLNPRGLIEVDEFMRTSVDGVYAVGDAVETRDLVFPDRKAWVALGNVANMQARVAADHIVSGASIPFRGCLGTSIVRVFDTAVAVTGWTEARLRAAGIPHRSVTITQPHHASYYPGAEPLTIKLTFAPDTGRILGAQAVGTHGVDKRIDVLATAITGGLTVEDLSLTQLTYSPPFGSARDPANVAGLAARNAMADMYEPVAASLPAEGEMTAVPAKKKVQLLDVRLPADQRADPLPGAINVPYYDLARPEVRATLDKDCKYRTLCNWGKVSYFANRHLRQAGFDVESIDGGRRVQLMRDLKKEAAGKPKL